MDKNEFANHWAIAAHEPLVPDAYRVRARQAMFRLALEERAWFTIWSCGLLADLIYTLDLKDPWRNTTTDRADNVVLPDGSPFGSWTNGLDVHPMPTVEDPEADLGLAALVEGLSPDAARLWNRAQMGREEAMEYMWAMPPAECYPAAQATLTWSIHRRRLFSGADDPFDVHACISWARRADMILDGQPWDESGAARLRENARIEPGSWSLITGE